jgi:hypothetical protein
LRLARAKCPKNYFSIHAIIKGLEMADLPLLEFSHDDRQRAPENDEPRQRHADGNDRHSQQAGGDRRQRRANRDPGPILSAAECLAALTNLLGLIAMGTIKPAQANAMIATINALLRQHQAAGSRNDHPTLSDDDVFQVFNDSPETFNLLSPFLTDEQIDLVMRRATEASDKNE